MGSILGALLGLLVWLLIIEPKIENKLNKKGIFINPKKIQGCYCLKSDQTGGT